MKWNQHLYFKNINNHQNEYLNYWYSLTPPFPSPPFHLACWALGASMTMPTNSSRSRCWGGKRTWRNLKSCAKWEKSKAFRGGANNNPPSESLTATPQKVTTPKESSLPKRFFFRAINFQVRCQVSLGCSSKKQNLFNWSAEEISCRVSRFILSGNRKHC